jgi:hypothetical protein
MFSHRLRNIGMSPPGMFSATGTRGSFTMPHSMASMSEKSLIVHGKSVPSAYPDPRRKKGVAERSIARASPSLRFTASRPEIQRRAASLFRSASFRSSPFRSSSSSSVRGFSR